MSLWSVLQGAASQLNPFDNGKTYSAYNPPKKKLNQPTVVQPPVVQTPNLTNNIPTARTPLSFGQLNNTVNIPTQPKQPQQNQGGFWNSLIHNPVTNVIGGVAKTAVQLPVQASEDFSNTFANLGNRLAGGQNQTIQENMGGDPLLNKTLQFSGATGQNKQLAGDVAQIGLTAAAPLADKFIANPITEKLAASGASKIGSEFIGNTAAGAPVIAGFNSSSAAGNGATAPNILASGLEGVASAPLFAAGGELYGGTKNLIRPDSNVVKIPVTAPRSAGVPIPVKTAEATVINDILPKVSETESAALSPTTTPQTLIKEVSRDATTPQSAAQTLADQKSRQLSDRFDSQDTPTKTISDVTPRQVGNPGYVTTSEVKAERNALNKALANKEITKAQHTAANKELDQIPVINQQPTDGKQIQVRQVNPIDVNKIENVPVNLPETPGKVRVTTQSDPIQAQSEAIAAQTPPAPVEASSDVQQPAEAAQTPKTIDASTPSDPFYQGLAEDLVNNIKQATKSNKELKSLVSAQKGERLGAATNAANNASGEDKLKAFFGNLRGKYADNTGYIGSNHSDEVVKRAVNDAFTESGQQGFAQANTARALQRMFRSGQTVDGHLVEAPKPSDVKLVKQFLNRKIGSSVGDNLDSAYSDLLANVPKKEDFGFLSNLTGLPRVLMTSGDLSVSGRQAFKLGLQHPVEFAKANVRAIKYALNPKAYDQAMSDLRNSDIANFVQDNMKVKLPMLAHTDDAYWGDQWANKIPVLNKFVQASERQYNAVLSDMRLASATKQIDKAGGLDEFQNIIFNKSGGDYDQFNKALGKWGDVINNLSGSGDIGNVIAKNPGIASILFAPRNLASKFNTFNPVWYAQIAKSNPAAAIYAAKSMGTYLATVGGTLLALKNAGASVELDPRSADFGVIKLGNTRIDFTGGDRTVATFIARMALGAGKLADNALPGNVKNVNTGAIQQKTPQSIVGQFLSNKLSPVAGLVNNMLGFKPDKNGTGITDAYGNPLNTNSVWATLANLTVPMTAQDVASAYNDSGSAAKAAGVGVASFLGAGANTYGSTPTKDQTPATLQASDIKAASTQALSDFKKTAGEGYGITQLPDGSYAYNINGKVSTTPELKTAQTAVLKDSFKQSGKSYEAVGDNVVTLNSAGNPVVTPKVQYDYQVGAANLISEKTANNLGGWMKTAQGQLDSITKQLSAGNLDPLSIAKLQNDAATLQADMAKYQGYGGFTKGTGSSNGISTSFGTLSSGSNPFAPTVQKYQTADLGGNSSIPVIQRVQPNIVHKIGTG